MGQVTIVRLLAVSTLVKYSFACTTGPLSNPCKAMSLTCDSSLGTQSLSHSYASFEESYKESLHALACSTCAEMQDKSN